MKDSGTQIPLVSREVVEKHHNETFGGVTIQGVVGEAVRAPLATLGIQVATEDGSQNLNPKLPIVCGVVDFNSRDYDVILPSSVVRELPEFKVKQMKPYRVPEAFRAEVDRQIQELLDLGLITPSFSSMASPIVCVAKKDGGVRIACDYRYVNKFTVGDAYLMPTVQETIRSLGNAKYITL